MVDEPGAHAEPGNVAQMMGMKPGLVVQELGWDEDADVAVSEAVEDAIGSELLDEDTYELCDAILLWWRDEDGDLVDGLVDTIRSLGPQGRIWLMTPAAGSEGTVAPGVISESAQLAGLVQTKAERFGQWQGSCLVARGTTKR